MCYKFTLGGIFMFLLLHSRGGSIPENLQGSIPDDLQKKFNCDKGKKCDSVIFHAKTQSAYNDLPVNSQVLVIAEKGEESLIKYPLKGTYHAVQTNFIKKTGKPKSKDSQDTLHAGLYPTASKTNTIHKSPLNSLEPSNPPEQFKNIESSNDISGPGLEDEGEYVSIENEEEIVTDTSTNVLQYTHIKQSIDTTPKDFQTKSPDANVPPSNNFSNNPNYLKMDKSSTLDITKLLPSRTADPAANNSQPEPAANNSQPEPAANYSQPEPAINISQSEPATDNSQPESATNISQSEPATNTSQSEPATDNFQPEPAANNSQLKPAANDSQPEPAANNSQPKPAANNSQPEPATDNSQPKTLANDSQPEPAIDNAQPEPAANNSQPNLAANYSQPKPAANNSHPEPATDYFQPTANNSQPKPAANNYQPEPAANYSQPKPAATNSHPEPATDSSHPEPATDNSQPKTLANDSQPEPAIDNSQPEPAANNSQPKPVANIPQSEPATDNSQPFTNVQPETAANKSQPKPATDNSQSEPTSSNSQPEDAENNFQAKPATDNYQPEPAANNSQSKLAANNALSNAAQNVSDNEVTNLSVSASSKNNADEYASPFEPTYEKNTVSPKDKYNKKHEIDNKPKELNSNNVISALNKGDIGENKDKISIDMKEIFQDKPKHKHASHIQMIKPVDSPAEHNIIHETENSFSLKMWEELRNGKVTVLWNYVSKQIASGPFSDYPSFIIILNTVLFLIFLLMLNCLSISKCNNAIKGKLYMCEKKLLEHNIEKVSIQELIDEKNKDLLLFDKLKEENISKKNQVDLLTSKIDELKEHEKNLTESLNEYKSKYQSLEEMSNKKNIKKNYEKLMDQVKVQKDKLDELAVGMEERAEILRKEKENVESLLNLQAEEHGKIINDYRMLLNNVELENNELREIVQTMSVDSDVGEKLLQAVKLQVRLSDLEKENNNLNHQLEGEREAHKLLEDHQRITQKEVNDLRESYETILKEKSDTNNKLKYITDYFQQLEDKLKKEISDKDELLNEKLGDDDSLAKALMNLRKENCVLNEENSILRAKYDSLKVELTDQKNEEKLSKTKLESEREQIWMDWRAAERKIESLNLDNKVLRSKLVAMGSKSESSFREMHTQTYDDPDKMLSPTSSLFLDHTSPVPQPAFFIPSFAIPPPPLSDEEMRQLYGPNSNYNQNGYHSDENQEHSYDHRLPPLGGTFSPPTLDNIPVPNIPPPLDNDQLWRRQTWNSQDISSNEEEASTQHNSYSRRRTGDSISSVSSSKRSFV